MEDGRHEVGQSKGRRAVIFVLLGAVAFLAALIAAVVAARQLRPVVASRFTPGGDKLVNQWIQQLQQGSGKDVRRQAAEAIVQAGPQAVITALDAVTAVSADHSTFSIPKPAVQAMADMGQAAVDALGRALASDKENVRVAAAAILREMGPAAEGALGPLAAAVRDENRWVRCFACDALGNLGARAAPAAEPLVAAVEHQDQYTRRRAIVALGRIGPAAKPAIPALTKVQQNDPEQSVRQAATVALHEVNLSGIAAEATARAGGEIRELIGRLQHDDQYESVSAAKTLARKGAQAKDAIPALALALQHKNKWVREAAAEALGAMGREAQNVAPALRRAAEDQEPEVRQAAQKALERIEG